MTNCRNLVFLSILTSSLFLAGKDASGQSVNSEANRWFQLGINAKDHAKKIESYKKAISVDPSFVEALYNLGIAYKDQQDYQRAELYLTKAYQTRPKETAVDIKLRILLELAWTYKRSAKFKECEETLVTARQIIVEKPGRNFSSLQMAIVMELARLYYQQGRYSEALTVLRSETNIRPEDREAFRTFVQAIETAVELDRLVAEGDNAKAQDDLARARALYMQVREKSPGFRNVEAKIAAMDSLVQRPAVREEAAVTYALAQKFAADGNLTMAIATLESLVAKTGGYKDATTRLVEFRAQQQKLQLQETLGREYATGKSAYEAKDWSAALIAFEHVFAVDSSFLDIRERVAQTQANLNQQGLDALLSRYYDDGLMALKNQDFAAALAAFGKAHQMQPNYRRVDSLLAVIDVALERHSAATSGGLLSAPVNVDSIYQIAVAGIQKKDWLQAVIAFEKIQILQPNYLDVNEQLALARAQIPEISGSPNARRHGRASIVQVTGLVVVMIAIPLIGILVFAPTMRARIQLLRNNPDAAEKIYERLLARNPGKINLYLPLANMYLLSGRRDDAAIQVYKKILQLNLPTQNRDKLTAIVAHDYLQQPTATIDAIEFLEKELKAEQRRLLSEGEGK